MNWNEMLDVVVHMMNRDTPVPPKQEGDTPVYHCSVCGSQVIADDNYCQICGQKLREEKE